jgi:hypothetical protein
VHQTVRWCTGQCPVLQADSGELAALGKWLTAYGYNSPDCPVCTGLSGEPTVGWANGRLGQRSAARSAWDTWPSQRSERGHRTVRCAPDSVRSANGSKAPMVGFAIQGRRSAPDCPVRPATEGKNCLPGMHSTAPSCLGAIKETPRRMEEHTKHSLSIPKHQDFDSTHLILCDSN